MIIRICIGIMVVLSLAVPVGVFADEPFFPVKKGMALTYFNYDGKGKKKDRDIYATVSDVTGEGGNMTVTYAVRVPAKPERSAEYKVSIVNGAVQYDATWFRRNDMVAAEKGALIPADMKPGTRLADMRVTLKERNKTGVPDAVRARLTMTDHRCVAKETITVPAGKFECYKVTYTTDGNLSFVLTIGHSGSGEIWYARGVGIVKMITYDDKGNVMERSELQSIKI